MGLATQTPHGPHTPRQAVPGSQRRRPWHSGGGTLGRGPSWARPPFSDLTRSSRPAQAPSDWLLACLLPGESLPGRPSNRAPLCPSALLARRLQSWRARGNRRVATVCPKRLRQVSALPPRSLGKGAFIWSDGPGASRRVHTVVQRLRQPGLWESGDVAWASESVVGYFMFPLRCQTVATTAVPC